MTTPRSGDSEPSADPAASAGTPRWVKVFGIIGLVVVVAAIVLLVASGGPGAHGPGRHTGRGDTPPATVTAVNLAPGGDAGGDVMPARIARHGGQEP